MASGANLLYKRSTFDKVDNIDSHIHAASGDDTYLLRDFRENNADVRLLTDSECAISTETPQSFKEFIDQRLRWIGKTGDLKDHLSTFLAVVQALLTVFFLGLLIFNICTSNWELLLAVFITKAAVDLLLFMPYFMRQKRSISLLFIPLYELIFPLYTILITILLFTYKPKWKGRSIYEKRHS
jgi:cellulose synthase/poly-beta-1,6-N-acetylglucosamine synthase-like glycosyltransferase